MKVFPEHVFASPEGDIDALLGLLQNYIERQIPSEHTDITLHVTLIVGGAPQGEE